MAPQPNSINTYTVADLPASPALGTPPLAIVTDALAPTVGSTVVGGGLVIVLVWFNGTAWHVVAL